MNLLLVRHAYLPEVTLGRLYVDDQHEVLDDLQLATLEEPWIVNPNGPGGARRGDGRESCVPDGDYVLTPHNGATFKNVYRLSNPTLGVFDFPDQLSDLKWGRASVLIHAGNTTDDILGCILVGLRHGEIKKPDTLQAMAAVFDSRVALGKLRDILGAVSHNLEIRPTVGTKESS